MHVAVYDPKTGKILRVVNCPEAAASGQALTGEAVIEVGPDVSDATHTIQDSVITPKT